MKQPVLPGMPAEAKPESHRIGVTERGDPAFEPGWRQWAQDGNPTLLITKNPASVEGQLKELGSDLNVIIHCTITGMGGSRIEPCVPVMETSLEAYVRLAKTYGVNRVVLRIDPIITTPKGLALARKVATHRLPQGRLRISFFDFYPHVRSRFRTAGLPTPQPDFHAPLALRLAIWKELGQPEVCGEPGLPSTGCVSEQDCVLFGVPPKPLFKGQRSACACLAHKTELLDQRHPCSHGCLYCYWRNGGP